MPNPDMNAKTLEIKAQMIKLNTGGASGGTLRAQETALKKCLSSTELPDGQLNAIDSHRGATLLMYAAQLAIPEPLSTLTVTRRADISLISFADNNGNTAMHYAASQGRDQNITNLLNAVPKHNAPEYEDAKKLLVNALNKKKETPLMVALLAEEVTTGHIDVALTLLGEGAIIDQKNMENNTLLETHVFKRAKPDERAVEFLIANGARVSDKVIARAKQKDADWLTDLLWDSRLEEDRDATYRKNIVQHLGIYYIDALAKSSDEEDIKDLNDLFSKRNKAVTKAELKHELNKTNRIGMTPLMTLGLKAEPNISLIRKLIEINPEALTAKQKDHGGEKKGHTLLMMAARKRCYPTIKFLLQNHKHLATVPSENGDTFIAYTASDKASARLITLRAEHFPAPERGHQTQAKQTAPARIVREEDSATPAGVVLPAPEARPDTPAHRVPPAPSRTAPAGTPIRRPGKTQPHPVAAASGKGKAKPLSPLANPRVANAILQSDRGGPSGVAHPAPPTASTAAPASSPPEQAANPKGKTVTMSPATLAFKQQILSATHEETLVSKLPQILDDQINAVDSEGATLLMFAAQKGFHLLFVKLVEIRNASVEQHDNNENSAFLYAARHAQTQILDYYFRGILKELPRAEKTKYVNQTNAKKCNALMLLLDRPQLANNEIEYANSLVKHGADVNAQANLNITALYHAIQNNYKDSGLFLLNHGTTVTRHLLDLGEERNAEQGYKSPWLADWLWENRNKEEHKSHKGKIITKFGPEHFGELIAQTDFDALRNIFHYGVITPLRRNFVIKKLASQDQQGRTPLMKLSLAENADPSLIKRMIELCPASLALKNSRGQNVLFMALAEVNVTAAEYFLKHHKELASDHPEGKTIADVHKSTKSKGIRKLLAEHFPKKKTSASQKKKAVSAKVAPETPPRNAPSLTPPIELFDDESDDDDAASDQANIPAFESDPANVAASDHNSPPADLPAPDPEPGSEAPESEMPRPLKALEEEKAKLLAARTVIENDIGKKKDKISDHNTQKNDITTRKKELQEHINKLHCEYIAHDQSVIRLEGEIEGDQNSIGKIDDQLTGLAEQRAEIEKQIKEAKIGRELETLQQEELELQARQKALQEKMAHLRGLASPVHSSPIGGKRNFDQYAAGQSAPNDAGGPSNHNGSVANHNGGPSTPNGAVANTVMHARAAAAQAGEEDLSSGAPAAEALLQLGFAQKKRS